MDTDNTRVLKAKEMLDQLTDKERAEVFGYYCTVCGSDSPPCHCWNDE